MEGIMIKRILLVAFVLGIVQWVSCVGARAQVVGCVGFVYCGAYSFDATCLPAPPYKQPVVIVGGIINRS